MNRCTNYLKAIDLSYIYPLFTQKFFVYIFFIEIKWVYFLNFSHLNVNQPSAVHSNQLNIWFQRKIKGENHLNYETATNQTVPSASIYTTFRVAVEKEEAKRKGRKERKKEIIAQKKDQSIHPCFSYSNKRQCETASNDLNAFHCAVLAVEILVLPGVRVCAICACWLQLSKSNQKNTNVETVNGFCFFSLLLLVCIVYESFVRSNLCGKLVCGFW